MTDATTIIQRLSERLRAFQTRRHRGAAHLGDCDIGYRTRSGGDPSPCSPHCAAIIAALALADDYLATEVPAQLRMVVA